MLQLSVMKHFLEDILALKQSIKTKELLVGIVALLGFIVHLALISSAKAGVLQSETLASTSILAAIGTPFTIIIIYEMLQLGASVKEPLLESVLFQFEIISLILIRNVFKLFADFETKYEQSPEQLLIHLIPLIAGSMFLYWTVRYLLKNIPVLRPIETSLPSGLLRLKQILSFSLIILISLAFLNYLLGFTFDDLLLYINQGFDLKPFFEAVFTLLIVADILVFLLTFIFGSSYAGFFENALLIVTAIVIRYSLTVAFPYDVLMVVLGCFVLLMTLFVKKRFRKISQKERALNF